MYVLNTLLTKSQVKLLLTELSQILSYLSNHRQNEETRKQNEKKLLKLLHTSSSLIYKASKINSKLLIFSPLSATGRFRDA